MTMRHATVLAATAVALCAALTGCAAPVDVPAAGSGGGGGSASGSAPPSASAVPSSLPATPSAAASAAAPTPAAAPPAPPPTVGIEPASVSIPALELDERLIPLGLDADGTMEVPQDFFDVGWFTGGGRPGGIGPTVIAGHVDSKDGAAVFYRLSELTAGDTVAVTAVDGSVFDYTVSRVESVPKSGFPTAAVFGATASDQLRLITCSGPFDPEARDYTENFVVFAERSPA